MANTEKMQALKLVRDAKKMINTMRLDTTLAHNLEAAGQEDQIIELEKLTNHLRSLENAIMQDETNEALQQMDSAAASLKAVNTQLKTDIVALKAVAQKINKVADAIGLLIDIMTKAAQLLALA